MTHKRLTQLLLLSSCLSMQHAIFCMDQKTAKLDAERQYLQSTNLEKITKLNEEPLTDTLREDLKEVVWVAVPNKKTWWQRLTRSKQTYTYKERTLQDARKRWNHKAADVTELAGPAIKGPHSLSYWFDPANEKKPVNAGKKKKNSQASKENDNYAASQSNMLFGKSLQTRHANPANIDDVIKRWQEALNEEAKNYDTKQLNIWNNNIANMAVDKSTSLDFNKTFKTKSEKAQLLYAIDAYKKNRDFYGSFGRNNPNNVDYKAVQTGFDTYTVTKMNGEKPDYTFVLNKAVYEKIADNRATVADQHLQTLCDQIQPGAYKIAPSKPIPIG